MQYDLSSLSPEAAAFFKDHGYLPQSKEFQKRLEDWACRFNAELEPHFGTIDRAFANQQHELRALFTRDHDAVGRVLKHHLIMEHYVTRYLRSRGNCPCLKRKTAAEKIAMIVPSGNLLADQLVPGMNAVNDARNKLGHDVFAKLQLEDVRRCVETLAIRHPYSNKEYSDPVDVVEDFTALVSKSLPLDKEILRIFQVAQERAGEL